MTEVLQGNLKSKGSNILQIRPREFPDAGRGAFHRKQKNSMSQFHLKLYVTGKTPRSEIAIRNLHDLCENYLNGEYRIEIIDILENPHLAENDRILATPTLVKALPHPIRRMIGDLSEKEKVLYGLDIRPSK